MILGYYCTDTLLGDDIVSIPSRPKKKAGRHPAFTEKKQAKYLERLSLGDRPTVAARNIKVSWPTVKKFLEADHAYAALCEEAEESAHQIIEDTAFRMARDGDRVMVMFYLQNRMPSRWQDMRGPRMLQQINGGGAPSVEWSLAEARAEAIGILDELEAKRQAKAEPIDATSEEQS